MSTTTMHHHNPNGARRVELRAVRPLRHGATPPTVQSRPSLADPTDANATPGALPERSRPHPRRTNVAPATGQQMPAARHAVIVIRDSGSRGPRVAPLSVSALHLPRLDALKGERA